MTRTWNDLEGVSLGPYWLKVCLTSSNDDAWYLIRYDTSRDAALRVRRADAPDADRQLEFWRSAMMLEHPHIVRMYDAGRAEAEDNQYIYCVCQYPDDFLAAALRERPLSPTETREVLDAILPALDFLHDRNLVHAAVDSTHIMAFGETIKLPSDTIRPAGEGITAASDMRSLGMLVHEMLVRDLPREDARTDYTYIPEPFRSIVRNTVKPDAAQRWTVADIRNHLDPPPAPPVSEPETLPAATEAHVASAPVVDSTPAPVPSTVSSPPLLPPSHRRPETAVDRGFPLKWVPVAGFAAAAILGAFVLRRPDPPTGVPETPAATVQATKKAAAPPSLPDQGQKPSPVRASPPPPKQSRDRTTADARPSTGAPIWRVIAYTYNARAHAEKRVKSINEKNPGLHAQVFSPKGDRAPYFVSLGGRMTLAEAERLQQQARSKGMPKDTFVRNFSN